MSDKELGEFIFEQEPELKKFYSCQTKAQLRDWFVYRVHRIDELSGQIDKCCELLDVGIKRGLDELSKVSINCKLLFLFLAIEPTFTLQHSSLSISIN